eukprot:TRINITY_DN59_c0_g1_i2.p1 TRINITY_DN59_c0_g1~~TRINITY_DN59_c0_g1_i2.p1  ORF type:complete len:365 (-),score=83.38 TRINITY_DN59_c0_g1_i2:333-1427(-)
MLLKESLSLSYKMYMEKMLESPAEAFAVQAGERDKPFTLKSFHLPPFKNCKDQGDKFHIAQYNKDVRPEYFVIKFSFGERVLCTVELHKWVKKELKNPLSKRSISAIQGVLEQVRRVFDSLAHLNLDSQLRDEWIVTFFYKPLLQNIGGRVESAVEQWKSCRLCTDAAKAEEDRLLEKAFKQMCPEVVRKQKKHKNDPGISHSSGSGDLCSATEQTAEAGAQPDLSNNTLISGEMEGANTTAPSSIRRLQPFDQTTTSATDTGEAAPTLEIRNTPTGSTEQLQAIIWADDEEYLIGDFEKQLRKLPHPTLQVAMPPAAAPPAALQVGRKPNKYEDIYVKKRKQPKSGENLGTDAGASSAVALLV